VTAVIERVEPWRDVLLRPAADGTAAWQVGADAAFVLGDHPAASRDSRQWGPVPLPALRHRLAPGTAPTR
jgi:type IV secretory pathway protease TraF